MIFCKEKTSCYGNKLEHRNNFRHATRGKSPRTQNAARKRHFDRKPQFDHSTIKQRSD